MKLKYAREDGNTNGVITRYELSAGTDGVSYTPVATGTWPLDATRKTITLPDVGARFLRLTALEAGGGYASAAEIQIGVPAR